MDSGTVSRSQFSLWNRVAMARMAEVERTVSMVQQ